MASVEGTFAITGIPPPQNVEYLTQKIPYAKGMPVRRELTEWFETAEKTKDPLLQKQWTLYIVALRNFMALKVDQRLSYFQIAGIHGYPQTSWDGAGPPPQSGDPDTPGANPFGGYCNHNTIAFPTWHRPYMLLYEQVIWMNMKEVVKDFQTQYGFDDAEAELWYAAADSWRLPYWDWAKKQTYPANDNGPVVPAAYALPYLLTLQVVPIHLPGPSTENYPNPFPNPLEKFENPERDENNKPLKFGSMPEGKEHWNIPDDGEDEPNDDPKKINETMPWKDCTTTSRWGITRPVLFGEFTGLDGVNNFTFANIALANAAKRFYKMKSPVKVELTNDLADAVNRMFSEDYNGTWGTFASTKWYKEKEADMRTGYMSLEYIHNNIHNITGGSTYRLLDYEGNPDQDKVFGLGHMCDVPVAAFDPVFWLHHCNIDRLTAIWQALYWDKWWDEKEGEAPPGEQLVEDVTPDTLLQPFHTVTNGDVDKDVWTSTQARDWTRLGYTYEDLVPLPEDIDKESGQLLEAQYIINLRKHINEIYPSTSAVAYSIRHASKSVTKIFGVEVGAMKDTFEDYVINVIYDRYALKGKSYSIRFYLGGEDSEDGGEFKGASTVLGNEDNFIGEVYSLGGLTPASGDGQEGCANCGFQNDSRALSKAQVPITIPLLLLAIDKNYSAIETIEQAKIEAYLKDHLYWKFVQAGGAQRSKADFPRTKISVWAGQGHSVQTEDGKWLTPKFEYDTYAPMWLVTEDRPSHYGLTRDDPVIGIQAFQTQAVEA